jgi:hypothetical protein
MPSLFTLRLTTADVQLLLRAFDLAEVQLLNPREGAGFPAPPARSDAFQLSLLRAAVTSGYLRQGFSLGETRPKRRRPRGHW